MGTWYQPEIGFRIRLPKASRNTASAVKIEMPQQTQRFVLLSTDPDASDVELRKSAKALQLVVKF